MYRKKMHLCYVAFPFFKCAFKVKTACTNMSLKFYMSLSVDMIICTI